MGMHGDYENGQHACVLVWKEAAVNALEYYSTPESSLPAELSFGTLTVREAPSVRHQEVVGSFFTALRDHVRARAMGRVWVAPLDVVLDELRALIVQPDVLFVSNDRRGIVGRRIEGPPDVMVEVLSPHPRVGDFERRLEWFATYGVRECWAYHQPAERLEIVDFERGRIARRRWIERDDSIDSRCLPAFSLTLGDVVDA
jgi:Uma2 family endonuclease